MTGQNLDGSIATRGDYVAASLGVALPIISGSFIKKIYSLVVNGTGADKLGQIVKKVENISTALDEKHVKAAVNDILGNPVIINGKTYDHLDEVQNALRGIGNQIGELNKLINSGNATEDVLNAAKRIRSELQIKKDAINDVLNRAKKKSAEND